MNNETREIAMDALNLIRKRIAETKESIRICDLSCDCDDKLCEDCVQLDSDWDILEEDESTLRRLLSTFPECRTNEKPLSKREMQDIIEDLLKD